MPWMPLLGGRVAPTSMTTTMATRTTINVNDARLLVLLGQRLGTGIVGGIKSPLSRCHGILAAGIWGGGKERRWATTMMTTTIGGGRDKPGLGEDITMLMRRERQAMTATSALRLSLLSNY
jgi:hypothetical protein